MAIRFTFNMTDEDVAKGIVSVGKRSKSIRKDMHLLAVSIMRNWAKSGDVKTAALRASQMLEHCDPAFSQKIVNWFGVHASFEMVESDGDKVFGYDGNKTMLSEDEFQAAKGETMFDLTPDNDPQPYDLRSKVLNLIAQAENRRTKGLKEGDDVPADLIASMKALVTAVPAD